MCQGPQTQSHFEDSSLKGGLDPACRWHLEAVGPVSELQPALCSCSSLTGPKPQLLCNRNSNPTHPHPRRAAAHPVPGGRHLSGREISHRVLDLDTELKGYALRKNPETSVQGNLEETLPPHARFLLGGRSPRFLSKMNSRGIPGVLSEVGRCMEQVSFRDKEADPLLGE